MSKPEAAEEEEILAKTTCRGNLERNRTQKGDPSLSGRQQIIWVQL